MTSFSPDKPICVIGANGPIEKALERFCAGQGIAIVSGDINQDGLKTVDSQAAFIHRHQPGVVVYAAEFSDVDAAESDSQSEALILNAEAPGLFSVLCSVLDIPLLLLSTNHVFNGVKEHPYVETDPCSPISKYGATKVAGEEAVRRALRKHVILRTQWVYGAEGDNFGRNLLLEGQNEKQLDVVCDQFGAPTSAEFVAFAIIEICETIFDNPPDDHWGTFHITNSGTTSRFEFAAAVFQLAKRSGLSVPSLNAVGILEQTKNALRPPQAILDIDKIQQIYGINAQPWELALAVAFPRILEALNSP